MGTSGGTSSSAASYQNFGDDIISIAGNAPPSRSSRSTSTSSMPSWLLPAAIVAIVLVLILKK